MPVIATCMKKIANTAIKYLRLNLKMTVQYLYEDNEGRSIQMERYNTFIGLPMQHCEKLVLPK